MVLYGPRQALQTVDLPTPRPGPGEVLIRVRACAVCRTDLHIVDGELASPKLPLVPGHEIVGVVAEAGKGAERFHAGDRVGVPWLGWTCGVCQYRATNRENLCDEARFTGYTRDGGYAEYTLADERFCFALPEGYADAAAAPLLCAGFIGYRSLVKTGNARRVGLYGFGAAAHLLVQVARFQGRDDLRLHPPGRWAGAGVREVARRRLGGGFDPAAAGQTGCGNPFCARWATWCHWRFGRSAKAASWCAAVFT